MMKARGGSSGCISNSNDPQPHSPPRCCGIEAKYVALLLLVVQTVGAILALRLSRTHAPLDRPPYLGTTAVCLAEACKLLGSLCLVARDVGWQFGPAMRQVKKATLDQPFELLKAGVPALLYTVQNNLIVIALSNLSAATYQVTYQLKILTTALLSVLLLQRTLGANRWFSLLLLTVGVALIEFRGNTEHRAVLGNPAIGLTAVLCACTTSGLAGVYLEKILKQSQLSIWLRNVQLALYGTIIGAIGVYVVNGQEVRDGGWLQGYTTWTWTVIGMQSAGGLIIAAVLKYADNILKCFGNALAIIFAACISAALGDEQLSLHFVGGTALVVCATFTYGANFNFMSLVPVRMQKSMRRTLLQRKGSIPDEEKGNILLTDVDTSEGGSTSTAVDDHSGR